MISPGADQPKMVRSVGGLIEHGADGCSYSELNSPWLVASPDWSLLPSA
jgi:hypothetical protein